jgi:hypothetical protein
VNIPAPPYNGAAVIAPLPAAKGDVLPSTRLEKMMQALVRGDGGGALP